MQKDCEEDVKSILLTGKIVKRNGRIVSTTVTADGYDGMTQVWGRATR